MKNILFASLIFSCALSYTACSDAPKGDKAAIGEEQQAANAAGQIFTVDTTDSHVRFTGHGVGKNHKGTFKLSSGTVAVANNAITGGDFTININSMQLDEKEAMFKDKLGPHLLSGDFFDAAKFGTSKFEITKVGPYEKNESDTSLVEGANYRVSGNLTLKETTKNVTFPARVDLDGNNLTAKANFDIDRRQWQMNYGNDKTLKDKFISETVNIELDLKAVKRAQ
jgi:polyisoprenoid-binding protein YceI